MTRRRWIADTWDLPTASTAMLTGAQAAHLARVLRAEVGMVFDIVADSRVYRGTITAIADDAVHFALGEELDADPALPITLLLAIFKFDRMEWAIEKATELGVACIVPVIARRTEKHLAQSAVNRVERWRRIVREAAQQSRRSDVVLVKDPILLKDEVKEEPESLRLLLAETKNNMTLRQTIEEANAVSQTPTSSSANTVRLAIGPEGGWTPEEEALFQIEGWKAVTLGPRILRAETAAITAVSVVAALWE